MPIKSCIALAVVVAVVGCASPVTTEIYPTEAAGEPLPQVEPLAVATQQAAVTPEDESALQDMIVVTSPEEGAAVTAPLEVSGEARGTWYFEATFPIELQGANGEVLGQGFATALGDWMTEDFVPFSATIEFDAPAAAVPAKLVLRRSNPSGLPEHDMEVTIPVTLGP